MENNWFYLHFILNRFLSVPRLNKQTYLAGRRKYEKSFQNDDWSGLCFWSFILCACKTLLSSDIPGTISTWDTILFSFSYLVSTVVALIYVRFTHNGKIHIFLSIPTLLWGPSKVLHIESEELIYWKYHEKIESTLDEITSDYFQVLRTGLKL
ncbi:hypothetical protein [Brevibacillus formosus]|uniref:hypothetical protein n=1 Tax=Brevibacillus formosus TaxID=54913 RepID=UPI0021012240|nr:hypothetical protein [Brevibacillus formosus]